MAPPSRWFPLESNPSLMNEYIANLGFATHSYQVTDVFSTEDWALDMIPRPVLAVLLLYPLTEKLQSACEQETSDAKESATNSLWFTKQRIGNACGTIGILHALLNTPAVVRDSSIIPDSWIDRFQTGCPSTLDPVAKAERLESDPDIAQLHDKATSSEQNATGRGNIEDNVVTHFVAVVAQNGIVYELDGRKAGPIAHGPSSGDVLRDGAKVLQKYMARDPTELRFTILALAPRVDDE